MMDLVCIWQILKHKNRNFLSKRNETTDQRYVTLPVVSDHCQPVVSDHCQRLARCPIILCQDDVQCFLEVAQIFIQTGCFRENNSVENQKIFQI